MIQAEIHKDRFTIIRHPDDGDHPVWRLYDGDELIVTASYRRGALELIDRLLEYEAIIASLRIAHNSVS